MRTLILILLLTISQLSYGQLDPLAEAPPADLPQGFPNLQFTFNPTYYSIGLKFGHVLTIRRVRPLLSTFEGELMMGVGSSPENALDRDCVQTVLEQGTSTRTTNIRVSDPILQQAANDCALFVNPWRFSFLSSTLNDYLVTIKDKPVIIYYINYYVAFSHILMNTRNEVLNIFPVQPDLKIESGVEIPAWVGVHPESGFLTGRVVHASMEFPIRKTYEVIIQESENANNFRAMSVSDRDLFQYITRAMLTGRQMRIQYVRLYGIHAGMMSSLFNYLTDTRIVSVDLL